MGWLIRAPIAGAKAAATIDAPLRVDAAPGERVYTARFARALPATPAIVWAILGDSNRWNRAMGMNPSSYRYEQVAPGARARVGESRYLGFPLRWVELGEWIEGRVTWGERRFLTALVSRAGFRFELEPRAGGEATHVTAIAYVAGEDLVGRVVALFWCLRAWLLLPRYLAALDRLLSQPGASEVAGVNEQAEEPATVHARRALLDREPSRTFSIPPSPKRGGALERATARLEDARVPPDVVARLRHLVEHRPDDEVSLIRPFDLATSWQLDRRAVLRACFHACRAGMLQLIWRLDCPRCRVGAAQVSQLARVDRRVHCEECDIGFDIDFAHNVEAAFQVSPSIRRVEAGVYCASSPWFRPHVYASLQSQPGRVRELACTLPRGELAVRLRGRDALRGVMITERTPQRLELTITREGVSARLMAAEGDDDVVVVDGAGGDEALVLLERAGYDAEIVRGSVVLTMPEFLDLFATEAPATGEEIEVGALTVLFSDLTGSTSLYERLGDARAFAIVQEHFRDTASIIDAHGGAVLKTMGDAVMASFSSPSDALAAAIEMVRSAEQEGRAHDIHGFGVKIGLHEGACLMVRANDRLDLFGTTVNLAARLQSKARPGQVVMLEPLWQELVPHPLLPPGSFRADPFGATLRGLSAERRLVALDPGRRASEHPRIEAALPVTRLG